jgi:class 3 adenylate cyclase/tetratricopeptide (TPR) repeat protein
MPDTPPPESLEGERKTVTALFADIKGSMDLIEDLDPEEARAIVDPALKLMMEAVHHYGGYVAQSTGDGIFALFGAPIAYEDHPQRALFAALRMQAEVRRYAERLRAEQGVNLQVRVGANTGEVVVREIQTGEKHSEYVPIGHATSVAARLQALAAPGSIAIGEPFRKLVEGYFALKSLGPARIKGVSEPLELYEVTGLGPLRTRLQRAAARGYTKFVGREREMEALRHAAEQAKAGHAQIVAAMAEPGVGKSRLFFEFTAISQSGWLVLDALSLSHDKATAYVPLIDLLHVYFRITPNDDARTRREKVVGKIAILDRSLEHDTVPHLFALLGIVEGDDPLAQMDPQVRRRRNQDAVKRILLRESLNQPLMLIFEDLHWIDEETEAFLNLFVEGMANAPVLLLVNYRPEYTHQWGSKTYYMQLRLDPLGKESAEEMLSALLGDSAALGPLRRIVIEKTEGNPLFMEEIFQALLEDGSLKRNGGVKLARPVEHLRLPPTVQGILSSRIDRLPPEEKDLLQTLAVIGTEFPLSLVRQVVQIQPDHLDDLLGNLQTAEFIYEQPAGEDIEYTFKHALTRQVADELLLSERRRLLHERTGCAIEALYANRLDDHLSELARHFDRSANAHKAVKYLIRAGQRAAEQLAHSEAIGCYIRALELLRRLPDDTARDRHELDLQVALSWSSLVAVGLRAPERESALVRARELCERLGDDNNLGPVLVSLAHLRYNQFNFKQARELAEEVFARAWSANSSENLAGAHVVSGFVLFATGQPGAAAEHFKRAGELYDAGPLRNHGGYLALNAPALLGAAQNILGHHSAAVGRAQKLLTAARRSSDPHAIAYALLSVGLHNILARETGRVAERTDEMLSIAKEHGLSLNLILGPFLHGWVMVAGGRAEDGIVEMRKTLSDPRLE